MNTVFETSTKNFDMIKIVKIDDHCFLTYFNDKIVGEDFTFCQALHEVERQLSL